MHWGRNRWRQAANLVGAVFQVAMTAFAATRISEVVESGPRSPVEPAGYAFGIWAVIFSLSLAYAIYQALPRHREDPLLQRIGWFTAGAFLCTGLWSVFVPERQTLAALGVFLIAWGALFAAYRGIVQEGRGVSAGGRWLVALPVGIFFGWVTAADLVAAALLIVGGVLVAAIVSFGRHGPIQAYLAYGATVLWALAGVIVNQWGFEPVTVAAAAGAAVLVAMALLRNLPVGPPPQPTSGQPIGSAAS
jgi:hypothetical protein